MEVVGADKAGGGSVNPVLEMGRASIKLPLIWATSL